MALVVRLMGAVTLARNGRTIEIGGPKQQLLLAVLALSAGRRVSTDRLVDSLWGDDPPATARRTVQSYVASLRRALGPDAPLQPSPNGYTLHIDRSDVDLLTFEDEVARLLAADAESPNDMARELTKLLATWDTPLGSVRDAPRLEQLTAPFEELHMQAIEALAAAQIAGVHAGDAVRMLEALVREHPTRENLWLLLAQGLAGIGRRDMALLAVQRAREALRDQLGVHPSALLTDLESALLSGPSPEDDTSGHERRPAAVASVGVEAPTVRGGSRGNLPAPLSSFIGRDIEIDEVSDQVVRQRLVTLVGPPGVGKTRLAIETARRLADRFDGGAWLVELSGIDDGGVVSARVADALGVSVGSGHDLLERLSIFLQDRDVLLVLDNCEHLAQPVATLVRELLGSCPVLHALLTSRQPLGVPGEVTWRTEPLSVESEDDRSAGIDRRADVGGAVRLFLDRARAADPSLTVTADVELITAGVCHRLAGLPLAIELAAARLRMMSLSQLFEHLDDEFALLADGSSQSVAHHRAMETTLDWSYQLLGPLEQVLFRRLSVFRGGFTLETIERFHATFPPVEGNALQLLGRLVDASMVERTPDGRLKMLEPIRHYGLLLLDEHGEQADARANHSLVYREMFRLPDFNLFGPAPGSRWDELFMAEIDNVRAAMSWADESDDTATIVELGAVAICQFGAAGYLAEAYRWLTRVLSVTSEPTPHRARALARGSFIAGIFEGSARAEALVDELEAVAEMLDDDHWRAATIERRAVLALHHLDFDTAARLWRDAASRLIELDNPSSFLALSNLMECLSHAGRYEEAQAAAEQLAEVGSRFDLPRVVADSLLGRSRNAVDCGDPDAAERYFDAADAYLRHHEHVSRANRFDPYGSALIPGFVALLRDDIDEAERLASAVVDDFRRSRHPDWYLRGLVLIGLVRFRRGDIVAAHHSFTEALAEAERMGLMHHQLDILGPIAATWATLDPPRGAALLNAVEAINGRYHTTPPAPVIHAIEQAAIDLGASLAIDELDAARRRGVDMSLDDAVALALRDD